MDKPLQEFELTSTPIGLPEGRMTILEEKSGGTLEIEIDLKDTSNEGLPSQNDSMLTLKVH